MEYICFALDIIGATQYGNFVTLLVSFPKAGAGHFYFSGGREMLFKMPPEWAPHQRMFMAWPVPDPVWSDNLLCARKAFALAARTVCAFEPVTMLVNPGQEQLAGELCGPEIDILTVRHDDCWVRDNGCTFVINQEDFSLHGIHWNFNAWGGKYPNYEYDRLVASFLCQQYLVPEHGVPLVLEGGSIHTNGRDTLLTTEECLLNPNRNPFLSRDEITAFLCSALGVSRVIYLPYGLFGDETDGHVDNIACFIDENTVLIPHTDDTEDPNYQRLLAARRTAAKEGLTVQSIIQPPQVEHDGRPLTLSYVNFVFVNGGIVMPGFGGDLCEYDALAKAQICALFPDRKVVQILTRDIIIGGGNIHCITQQMPAV